MSKIKPFILLIAFCILATEAFCVVDPLSGSYSNQATDLILQYRSIQLEITRSYHSILSSAFPDKPGRWFFRPLDKQIFVLEEEGILLLQDGMNITNYIQSGIGSVYESDSDGQIVFEEGKYTLSQRNGTQETFDGAGRLTAVRYVDGNSLSFAFNNGQMTRITSNKQELLSFYYNSEGQVEQIKSVGGASCYYTYNAAGLLVEAVNEDNLRTSYEYDRHQRLTGVQYQTGDFVNIKYSAKGGIVQSTVNADGQTTYTYKKNKAGKIIKTTIKSAVGIESYTVKNKGNLIVQTDVAGNRVERHFNDAGLPTRYVDAAGHQVGYRYDSLGRLTELVDPDGGRIRFFYIDGSDLVREKIAADGTSQQFFYNDKRQLIKVVGPGNTQIEYQYNKMGLVEKEFYGTGKNRYFKQYAYDNKGALTGESDSLNRQTTYSRDSRGRVSEMTDPLKRVAQFKYDQFGKLVKTVSGGQTISSSTYDEKLRLVQTRDAAGQIMRYTYDDRGNLESILYPDGGRETYTYDKLNRMTAVTTPAGSSIAYRYDDRGLMTGEILPGHISSKFRYDPTGNLIEETDDQGNVTRWDYDAMGQIRAVNRPGGIRHEYDYDRSGRFVAEKDAEGHVKNYRYDPAGNLTTVTLPSGEETLYSYDQQGFGNLTSVQTSDGRKYRREYDAAGRLVQEETPWGEIKSYVYDNGDRLVKKLSKPLKDGKSKSGWKKAVKWFSRDISSTKSTGISYQYDDFDRITELAASDGYSESYTYDTKGNPVEIRTTHFEKNLRYNRSGELISEEYPALGKTVRYSWDNAGNRTALQVPGYLDIKYTYDKFNLLVGIEYQPGQKIRIAHDKLGRKKLVTYPNGINISYQYNKTGQLNKIAWLDKDDNALEVFSYTINKSEKLLNVVDSKQNAKQYEYDANGQLTRVSDKGQDMVFEYGPSFQRVAETTGSSRRTFEYNDAGQMVTAGQAKIAYDAAGNVSSKSTGHSKSDYGFDALGRLTQLKSSQGVVEYAYGPDGQRVSKMAGGKKQYYIYDGLDLIMELDEDGEPLKIFIHAPGIDAPLVMLSQAKAYFYLPDYLGSIKALADESGAIVTRYDYDPFGRMTRTGADIGNPFAFTGRVFDAESSLYYYRARYYDPELGVFLSPDPYPKALEKPQTFNEYAYVENDPANLVDPLGLSSLTQHYLRQQIAPPFFLYPVQAPGESVTSPQFWNRMANDYKWLRENFGPGTADNFRRRLQQKLIKSMPQKRPGIVSRLLNKGLDSLKRLKDKAILEGRRLKLMVKQGFKPATNTSASQAPAVPNPGSGGASTATGHGPVEGIGHGPSPGGATAAGPQGPGYFSRVWSFAGPTVKRLADRALLGVLGAVIAVPIGNKVGKRWADDAKKEGRNATVWESLLSGGEAVARASAAVITYGISEGLVRIGQNFYWSQKAIGKMEKNKQHLAAVLQKAKEKSDMEKKKGSEGQTRLEKWLEKIETKWWPRIEHMKKDTGTQINMINGYSEDMAQAADGIKKYATILKEDIDCKDCQNKISDLVELSKTRGGALDALMAQHKEARRLSRSICLDPKAKNAEKDTKRAKQAADIAKDLAKTLQETEVRAKLFQKDAIQCAQKATAYDKILKTNRKAVVKERVATEQKLKKLLKDARGAYNQITAYRDECVKLKNSMNHVYETTRKLTDKTAEYLSDFEVACRDIDYDLKHKAKESFENATKTYDAMLTQCKEVESEMDMKKPCNIPEAPVDAIEAEFEALGDTAEMFAHQALNYSRQAVECFALKGGSGPDKNLGPKHYFVLATGDSSGCRVNVTDNGGLDSAKKNDQPGQFADILGGPLATWKAAEDACYKIAESRSLYIHSDQMPDWTDGGTIYQMWYIDHRGQHCWIDSCVPWEKRGELTKKRKRGTPPGKSATAGPSKGPTPGSAEKEWSVYVKVIDAQGSGIEEASVTTFMGQLRAKEIGGGTYLLGPIKPGNLSPSYSTLDIKAEAFNRYGGGVLRMYKTKRKTIMLGKAPIANVTIQFEFSQGLKKDEPPPYIKMSGQSEDDKDKPSKDVPEYIKQSDTTVTRKDAPPKTRVVKPPVLDGPPKTGSGTGSPPKKPQPPEPKPKQRKDPPKPGDPGRKLTAKECEQKSCPDCVSLFGKGFTFDGSETPCEKCLKAKAASIEKCKGENQ